MMMDDARIEGMNGEFGQFDESSLPPEKKVEVIVDIKIKKIEMKSEERFKYCVRWSRGKRKALTKPQIFDDMLNL